MNTTGYINSNPIVNYTSPLIYHVPLSGKLICTAQIVKANFRVNLTTILSAGLKAGEMYFYQVRYQLEHSDSCVEQLHMMSNW